MESVIAMTNTQLESVNEGTGTQLPYLPDSQSLISPPINPVVLLWVVLLGLPGVLLFLILTKHF